MRHFFSRASGTHLAILALKRLRQENCWEFKDGLATWRNLVSNSLSSYNSQRSVFTMFHWCSHRGIDVNCSFSEPSSKLLYTGSESWHRDFQFNTFNMGYLKEYFEKQGKYTVATKPLRVRKAVPKSWQFYKGHLGGCGHYELQLWICRDLHNPGLSLLPRHLKHYN